MTALGAKAEAVALAGGEGLPDEATTPERHEYAPPSGEFLSFIPRDFARQHLILSVGHDEQSGTERLLIAPSTDPAALHNLAVHLGRECIACIESGELIAQLIDEAYAAHAESAPAGDLPDGPHATTTDLDRLLAHADRDLLSTTGKGDVVKLVDAMLFEALGRGASDVHVQPLADRTLVRYRVDGVLHTARELPTSLTAPIVSRIKVIGRMDIAEQRVPQDGRASVTIGRSGDQGGGRSIDLRISTLPTSYGERAVIRLLDNDRGRALTTFEALGMPDAVQAAFLDRAGRSSGIILLTGPTGSGKTTTLYTTLRWLAARSAGGTSGGDLNVMTIEDPIEYELSTAGVAISQAQVNTKKGVTFASGLRHILRQDPDVVMVGEIRDAETARIAIQASLTGHLVFSTLHTNDAASAVTRLVDLGVEPYLVSASLSAVLAQRLVRKTHRECGGKGCEHCLHSGFLGRLGIFELLLVDEHVRDLITTGASASAIRSAARKRGMRTLHEQGEQLMASGTTTRAEVDRVTLGALEDAR